METLTLLVSIEIRSENYEISTHSLTYFFFTIFLKIYVLNFLTFTTFGCMNNKATAVVRWRLLPKSSNVLDE